jgi:hypothetical protein
MRPVSSWRVPLTADTGRVANAVGQATRHGALTSPDVRGVGAFFRDAGA